MADQETLPKMFKFSDAVLVETSRLIFVVTAPATLKAGVSDRTPTIDLVSFLMPIYLE